MSLKEAEVVPKKEEKKEEVPKKPVSLLEGIFNLVCYWNITGLMQN